MDGYEDIYGGFGFVERNNGVMFWFVFLKVFDLLIVKCIFKKRDSILLFLGELWLRYKLIFFLLEEVIDIFVRIC